jgi:DsbC/DsbD-like thiol-disulfide interchange protein
MNIVPPPHRIAETQRMIARVILFFVCVFAMHSVVHAEMTPWAVNEGGRMRIVVMPPEPDGKVRGALQIEPKAGWITYWKEPGDTGIPPQLLFSQNGDVHLDSVSFPVPKRIDSGKLRDIGYDEPVTFPFELTVKDFGKKSESAPGQLPGQPTNLIATAFIGLCRNICIPFQAEFPLAMQAAKGTPVEEAMILNAAAAKLPQKQSDDFRILRYAMVKDGRVLRLTLRLPDEATAQPQVIVTGPEGHVLFDEAKGKQEPDGYTLDMPVGKLPKGYDIKGKKWGILAISGNRAIETSLSFD